MRTKKNREAYIRQYDFLVLEACRRYRKRIDPDDCYVIAQIALMDAIEHYHPGYAAFPSYALRWMHEAIDQEEKKLNQIEHVESKLSLDQPVRKNEIMETVGATFFRKTGDCAGYIELKLFIDSLPHYLQKLAWLYVNRETDEDVAQSWSVPVPEIRNLAALIQDEWVLYDDENNCA